MLYFLKEETFSDFRTLKKVVGYKGKHNHAMYNLLNKAVAMGFLNKYEYPVLTGKKPLWGITMQGLAMVVSANDKVFPAYFEPGKLKHWTLEHRLLNQRVRIALEQKGGKDWLNGDRGSLWHGTQVSGTGRHYYLKQRCHRCSGNRANDENPRQLHQYY